MIAGLYQIFNHWHSSGTVWIISDPHFGDEELAAGIPERPSPEEMVKLINSKVGKKDTLIILGDVGDVSYVSKLKGYKILVMGNHDAGRINYEKVRKVLVYNKDKYSIKEVRDEALKAYPNYRVEEISAVEDFLFPHADWEVVIDNNLFDEIYEGPIMIGEKLILSHEPVNVPWAFNIHGHIHDALKGNDDSHFNVCADVIGYLPMNLNQFMKEGHLANIETIHREAINRATRRKRNENN